MPVMVVGGDTEVGAALVEALLGTDQEVRTFVTDAAAAARWRPRGVKVATGDVSDSGHVSDACLGAITAVLVVEAASDGRERSFAAGPAEVLAGWVEAVEEAAVTRVIWVSGSPPPITRIDQEAVVDPSDPGVVSEVIRLDEAAAIPGRG